MDFKYKKQTLAILNNLEANGLGIGMAGLQSYRKSPTELPRNL